MTAKKSAPAAAAKPATPVKVAAAKSGGTNEDVAKPRVSSTSIKTAAVGKTAGKAKTAAVDEKAKRGRKPAKSDPKAKKSELGDEDFSDLEADLEGEPEAEVVESSEASDDGETKVKVKPLRMKVSRAKERALMRE
ncbi:MAG: RNA polymerase sigma factor RpoD, partial [Pseudomonadota bacterium]|nr:RNA polymerase sigma factor RpoD [Pseudomonadota bacterium]